jgi:hypothetical protein
MREGPLSIEYRELLNPSQLEAVLHSETPLLVLAALPIRLPISSMSVVTVPRRYLP